METVIVNKEKRRSYKKNSDERIGETRINTLGSKMWIIEYVSYHDITVQFESGYVVKAQYSAFKSGLIKSPYDKSFCGIGYLGEGIYSPSVNGKRTNAYINWQGILIRSYNVKNILRHPTYSECAVDPEWHNFQTFAKWYDENYYEVEGQKMCLDKDILLKGNKVYSSETCVFVPMNINLMFTKCNSKRGVNPIGVYYDGYKYISSCRDNGTKQNNLGRFDTPKEAFNVYKIYKEQVIKKVAEEYKGKIPEKLYIAMNNYIVSIDD